jgi:hypothetical protein
MMTFLRLIKIPATLSPNNTAPRIRKSDKIINIHHEGHKGLEGNSIDNSLDAITHVFDVKIQ